MSDESNNIGDELPPVPPTEVPPAPPTAIPTELPPEQPTAVSAETSTAATTMETDLKIFQIDNEILAGTGMPPSPAGASAAAGDGNATGASTEDESGGEKVADANGGAQLYAIDDDSVKTEDSASSSSYSSSASTESSNDSESSTSSEDPSEIGGVKIEEIDDTESEEEEEEEEVRDAVLLKEDVEMAEKQASANNNSLMYDDDDEISYKESFGDATNIISNGKQQQFRKGGRKSKKRLGQDRASVRKMVGQKIRGRGWDNRRKYLKKMSRTGVEGGMDLESGNNGDGASGRINNRPSGWTAAYKRRRIWYCCFSAILIIVGVSLLIYGVAKERAVSRSNANNFDDELFYDDEFLDDGVNSPAQSPSRPTTPGGQPSPSAPFPSGVFEPTGTPTYAGTMMPTLNPTPSNTPELTSKPVVATDNALLSLLKIAYADNLEDDSPDILEKYEKLLDRETYMNAPYSEQSIQWRSYEYIYNQRTDVMDNNNVLLMDEERILQIYGLLCFYHNFQWMQEGAGECLWSGVTCRDVREGAHNDVMYPSANDLRVVSIDVRGNGPDRKDEQPLEGELPLELMFLPYLETLDVSHNKLNGEFPKEAIEFWDDMKVLSLNDNMFEGDIPTEIGYLESLQKLTLHHNEFLGEVASEICSLRDGALHFLWVDCSPMPSTNLAKVSCDSDCCSICFEGYDDDGGPATGGKSPSTSSETPHVVQNDQSSDLKAKLIGASGSSLLDISSPQFHAYSWLVEDSASAAYSDERLFQRYALATLYYSTAGVQWTSSDSWITSTDECQWYGISGCDEADDGEIVSLELFGNNLVGTIPSELFTFIPNVINLNLANNNLKGQIPSEIGSLTKINILELAENQLTGQIPSEMGMMQNADHIFLQSNQFIGEVPWALCLLRAEKSLTLLWADCRGVNPRVKCSVKCCTTCFSGESSSSLSNGGGNVDGDSESPPGEDAPLSESDSDGNILAVLKKMAPDGGATLENSLTPQYKAYSWLVETGYEWVSDILTLQRYALATLYFATSGAGWLDKDGWLTDDDTCNWSGVSECNQGKMVIDLELYQNNLVGTIPVEISHLRMIEIIDFSSNDLYGTIPTELGWFEELESLSLDDNFLSGEIPSELGLISTLSELYVHFNEFVGEIPEDICALRPTAVGDGSKTTGLDEVWADCGDDPPQVACIEETCCTKCFSVADADGTYAPTELPTMYPTQKAVPALSENEDFRLFLLEHMDGFEDSLSALNKDSPQYEAYLWLANTSNFDDLDAFQRIQRFGLVSFYLSTSVDLDWKISNRWKTEQSVCKWHGITCDDDEITVKQISLPRNRLSGTMPREIALVGLGEKIEKLDLSGNELEGQLPTEIGTLKNLEILDLRSNDFTGDIPIELGNLSKLEILNLEQNSFIGEIPTEICTLRSKDLLELTADCSTFDPLNELVCSDTCCTNCF